MTGHPSPIRAGSLRILPLVILLGLGACASPPRGADRSGGAETPPAASEREEEKATEAGVYDFEAEGEFPEPTSDVEFEEDRLPPPESVEGQAIERGSVDSEELDAVETPFEEPEIPVPAQTETPVQPEVEGPVASEEPSRGARGFRVQLAATVERADADRVAREARNRLQTEVYVVLEGSLYKVRAGDFVDRGDALLLRDRSRANGYPEAWIVPTEIER